ncbi:MAG: pirin family protein [Saprospirales bacterium]|nr:MAG: pirin family protein [Saprospirales bacterium]
MSNIELIIEERAANIGNFLVGRLLPFRQKRSVGPFVFIDHMGPVKLNQRENFDILPHPHIGLSTLTYLFEGSIMHRDSIGSEVEIKPGAVNWMTAGRGVVHSERTPDYLRHSEKMLHGLQIWVALPRELEEVEPSFYHIAKEDIPVWTEGDVHFKLIAGHISGRSSVVPVHSKLYLIELKSTSSRELKLGSQLFGESGLYILQGSLIIEGSIYGPRQILIAQNSELCNFEMGPDTIVYIFGGEPFPEERYIDWNFVSSSKERLKMAKEDWIQQRFPKIPGEKGFVPYPGQIQ